MSILYILLLFVFEVTSDHEFCDPRCDRHSYCCDEDRCCPRHQFSFFSTWYFWVIIGLLILTCATSCSYYCKKRRMMAIRRRCPPARPVVLFTSDDRQHAPVTQALPPSYQEATVKPFHFPPPYYATDPLKDPSLPPYSHYSASSTVPPSNTHTLGTQQDANTESANNYSA